MWFPQRRRRWLLFPNTKHMNGSSREERADGKWWGGEWWYLHVWGLSLDAWCGKCGAGLLSSGSGAVRTLTRQRTTFKIQRQLLVNSLKKESQTLQTGCCGSVFKLKTQLIEKRRFNMGPNEDCWAFGSSLKWTL